MDKHWVFVQDSSSNKLNMSFIIKFMEFAGANFACLSRNSDNLGHCVLPKMLGYVSDAFMYMYYSKYSGNIWFKT